MRKLFRRIYYFFRRADIEAGLAEEMEFHRAMLACEFEGDRTAAARAWGNATLAREDARAVWLRPWIESFWRDFNYALRGLWRERGFAAVALSALAIPIGLNSALFTVFNAIALRPWPVSDPSHVVKVMRILRGGPMAGEGEGFGVAEWRYFSARSKTFSGLFLTSNGSTVRTESGPLRLTSVSGNFFSVLGVEMVRGRGFLPEEDQPLAPQGVAVLSYDAWQNRFGGDPNIVGKPVRLDEIPLTVVGVAAQGFAGTNPNRVDLWVPFSADRILSPQDPGVLAFLNDEHHCCVSMAGRLAPGYTRAQAAAEIQTLAAQLHTDERFEDASVVTAGTAVLQALGPRNKARIVPMLAAMFAAMTLVLLLACANVGNLLLARAAARRQEIAVRLSLGGTRSRLVRQLLVESLTLACAAAAAGLLIAWKLPAAIVARIIPENGIAMAPDWRVCAYTAGIAVVACLVFGLVPALQATHPRIAGALHREAALRFSRLHLRSVLLAAQVAISVVLLAGAGLLVRGLQHVQHQDPGFRIDGVTVATLELPAAVYGGKRSENFTSKLQTALTEAQGLPPTGLAFDAPMGQADSWTSTRLTGSPAGTDRMAQLHQVSAGYFDVLGIRVLAGRNFTPADAGRFVVLINETCARLFFGERNPVGGTFGSGEQPWEVVGLVKDAYTTDLSSLNPTIYYPLRTFFGIPLVLARDLNPAARERLTAIVRQIEPKARVRFAPLTDNFRATLEPARNAAAISGALGLFALILAAVGMSGVFAYMVRQRTREIGLRMALGSQPAQVVRLVLASHLHALAWGFAAGLAGGLGATRLLRSMMYGISPFDPAAYIAVFVLLIAAAAAASAIPARRAARVDPLTALRWE